MKQAITHAGSMDVMVAPVEESTKSLLMKRPVGCDHVWPFGAVRVIPELLMVPNRLALLGADAGIVWEKR